MAKTNECWGIEVGTSALKAVRLVKSGGEVEVADYEIVTHKQVLTTPDLDPAEPVRLALDALTSKYDLSKSSVVVSVPGNRAFARFAKLPPVEPKKIPDIVRFEAVQQIPFPIEQVEWDYQVFQQEDSPDVEVGIFAITKDRVNEFLRNYRSQGIDVDQITLSPVGVFNAFAHEGYADDADNGTIIMDIGGVSTDLIIIEGGGIWLRTLPIGGANFTEALVKAFKLSYSKAEKLKREAATSKYARQIFQAMRPVFSDLVQEVQKSLGYYQSLNRDSNLTRVVGLGSTFRLPGLQKFLKQQLQMDVSRPNKFSRVGVEGKREADFADHAMNLATAYGLALQGLGVGRVQCNLLPSYLMRGRMWKAKQPWFAAAAACLVLAAGLAFFALWNTQNRWQQEAQRVDQRFDAVVNEARGYASEWQRIRGGDDPRQRIQNVRGILDYRDLWAGVTRDISLALDTVDVDPAVYVADYGVIARLPDDQRRRVYIERIEVAYLGTNEQPPVAITSLRDPDTFWPTSNPQDDTHAIGDNSPRYEVVVRGFIDANESTASRVLTDGLIEWLQDNADRPDRPYVVDPASARNAIRSLTTGTPPGVQPATDRRATPARAQPSPRAFGGQARNAGAGRELASGARSWNQLAVLLPENPMPTLVNDEVTEFVAAWRVVLRRPEEARNLSPFEATSPTPPTTDAPGPEATSPDADAGEAAS